MNTIIKIAISSAIVLLFFGCTSTPLSKINIEKQEKVKQVNHNLTSAKQEEIKKHYFAKKSMYTPGPFTSVNFTAVLNLVDEVTYNPGNTDLKKEKLYICEIVRGSGKPKPYFNKMFVISNEREKGYEYSAMLNYNNVNDIQYANSAVYHRDNGEIVFSVIEWNGFTATSELMYKCQPVKNTIFK